MASTVLTHKYCTFTSRPHPSGRERDSGSPKRSSSNHNNRPRSVEPVTQKQTERHTDSLQSASGSKCNDNLNIDVKRQAKYIVGEKFRELETLGNNMVDLSAIEMPLDLNWSRIVLEKTSHMKEKQTKGSESACACVGSKAINNVTNNANSYKGKIVSSAFSHQDGATKSDIIPLVSHQTTVRKSDIPLAWAEISTEKDMSRFMNIISMGHSAEVAPTSDTETEVSLCNSSVLSLRSTSTPYKPISGSLSGGAQFLFPEARPSLDCVDDVSGKIVCDGSVADDKDQPKTVQQKMFSVNEDEKFKKAKETVENAIKYKKVFTIQGGYSSVRRSLRRRGWVEKFYRIPGSAKKIIRVKKPKSSDDDDIANDDDDDDDGSLYDDGDTDVDQPRLPPWEEDGGIYAVMSRMVRNITPTFFWVLRHDAVDYRSLTKEQMINHFCRVGALTTKAGLCVNLKNVFWYSNCDYETFFPRCYRLSNDEEKEAFIDDFRLTACMNIVRAAVLQLTSSVHLHERPIYHPQKHTGSGFSNRQCDGKVDKPMNKTPSKNSSQKHGKSNRSVISTLHKEKSQGFTAKANRNHVKKTGASVPYDVLETAAYQCEKFLASKAHEDIDLPEEGGQMTDQQWNDLLKWSFQLIQEKGMFSYIPSNLAKQCQSLVHCLAYHCPQFEMSGIRNVWIVKPGAKSRGKGIMCYDKLEDMLKLVSSQVIKKDGKYVVQKYIERPLLIYNTKFDIRQWFLVTDWNPLTVWFYRDSYLRFCSQQFTLDNFDQSIHLSNNSIQKYYKNGPRSPLLPVDNMWTHNMFKEYLGLKKQAHIWDEKIYPQMKKAVICTLLVTQSLVQNRKSSFELYGADFILTEDYSPWLLEINSSPSMESSTSVTAKMCPAVLDDIIKVVIDRKYNRNCDTGKFELAYRQPILATPPYVGIGFCVEGHAIKKPGSSNRLNQQLEPSALKKSDIITSAKTKQTSEGPVLEKKRSLCAVNSISFTTETEDFAHIFEISCGVSFDNPVPLSKNKTISFENPVSKHKTFSFENPAPLSKHKTISFENPAPLSKHKTISFENPVSKHKTFSFENPAPLSKHKTQEMFSKISAACTFVQKMKRESSRAGSIQNNQSENGGQTIRQGTSPRGKRDESIIGEIQINTTEAKKDESTVRVMQPDSTETKKDESTVRVMQPDSTETKKDESTVRVMQADSTETKKDESTVRVMQPDITETKKDESTVRVMQADSSEAKKDESTVRVMQADSTETKKDESTVRVMQADSTEAKKDESTVRVMQADSTETKKDEINVGVMQANTVGSKNDESTVRVMWADATKSTFKRSFPNSLLLQHTSDNSHHLCTSQKETKWSYLSQIHCHASCCSPAYSDIRQFYQKQSALRNSYLTDLKADKLNKGNAIKQKEADVCYKMPSNLCWKHRHQSELCVVGLPLGHANCKSPDLLKQQHKNTAKIPQPCFRIQNGKKEFNALSASPIHHVNMKENALSKLVIYLPQGSSPAGAVRPASACSIAGVLYSGKKTKPCQFKSPVYYCHQSCQFHATPLLQQKIQHDCHFGKCQDFIAIQQNKSMKKNHTAWPKSQI